MRSEWVPVSAAALVTGVMALVLGQMLNPAGNENSPSAQLLVAAEYPGRWLAMSILFFGAAAAIVLGTPAILMLFQDKRGRGLGVFGVVALAIGCVGVGGLAALMLMFRALAIKALERGEASAREMELVTSALEETGLQISLTVWVHGFLLGILLIALGLLRSRRTPAWVPGLLLAFLAMQVVLPFLHGGTDARIASALGLILLAGGFTGIATNATSPQSPVRITQTLAGR